LRQHFPKSTEINRYTPEHLRAVEDEINHRPRRVLGDRSPAELFTALLASPDHQKGGAKGIRTAGNSCENIALICGDCSMVLLRNVSVCCGYASACYATYQCYHDLPDDKASKLC